MEQDELIELRNNIEELETFIKPDSGIGLAFESNTGKLALTQNGNTYHIRNVIKRRMKEEPTAAKVCERALELVEEIDAGMAKYIEDYGKLPPELYTH